VVEIAGARRAVATFEVGEVPVTMVPSDARPEEVATFATVPESASAG